jgi:hypothetical protein
MNCEDSVPHNSNLRQQLPFVRYTLYRTILFASHKLSMSGCRVRYTQGTTRATVPDNSKIVLTRNHCKVHAVSKPPLRDQYKLLMQTNLEVRTSAADACALLPKLNKTAALFGCHI